MADSIKTFVVYDAGISQADVEGALPRNGEVEIVGFVSGLDDAWVRLHETPNDVLLIACSGRSEPVLNLIDNAVAERPRRPVVVMTYGSPNGFTQQIFAAGADDVVMLPVTPNEVLFTMQKALARKASTSEGGSFSRGSLICVLGPKGGTGKTLTSTSLAVALVEYGKRVALVDLDLQFGDVGLTMGLTPEQTIFDLVRTGGSLDEEKLDGFLMTHATGLKVLIAPSRPDHAAVVSVDFLRDVYSTLRTMFDYIVVDTPPGFTPEVIATIDNASSVVMVGMLDALSLKNTKLGLETLDLMGFPADNVKLVLNRARSRVGISEDEVVAIMGREPDVFVPSDRDIPRAVNEGKPILISQPQSEASIAFRQLAAGYVSNSAQPSNGQVRGLRRLFAKRA
ncbi:MAG TPA: AAA family ATPase [Gaiellaceae bacterium]|nr:AAA family ATPase [Gaiellaceae bacterium]